MRVRRHRHQPKFPLEQVQALVSAGDYYITDRARQDAETLAFDEDDILECVATLTVHEHYSHTVDAINRPGFHHELYRRRYHGFALYI